VRVSWLQYGEYGPQGEERRWTWVTDLEISRENARWLARGGRCRWKIENETFNTLKNQGYGFEHKYGHGEKELGARVSARRRDVSLQTRNARGTRAMDTFTTIVQTAKKLGVSAYAYFYDRISRRNLFPSLASLIRVHAHSPPLPSLPLPQSRIGLANAAFS
jgi:hypothetical protein